MAFDCLPAEINDQIVDEIDTHNGRMFDLKALRLSCRKFAYSPRILPKIFSSIYLQASPSSLQIDQSVFIAQICPWVKHVTFLPSEKSCTKDLETFKEIVLCQATREYMYAADHGSRNTSVEGGYNRFIEKDSNGKLAFSGKKLMKDLDGQNAKSCIYSDDLLKLWTNVLRASPSCHSCEISRMDDEDLSEEDASEEDDSEQEDTVPHKHDSQQSKQIRRQMLTLSGNLLFEAAISCLSNAGAKIEHLDIDCDLKIDSIDSDFFRWHELPVWDKLDFTRLKTLIIQPYMPEDIADDEEKNHLANKSINALLERCRHTLESLTIGDGIEAWFAFPANSVVALPSLARFETCQHLRPAPFAEFITQAYSLQHLELVLCNIKEPGRWRNILDAIRHHPSRMQVNFDQIMCETDLSIHLHTAEAWDYPTLGDVWGETDKVIGNYLSRRGEWNYTLREWFDPDWVYY